MFLKGYISLNLGSFRLTINKMAAKIADYVSPYSNKCIFNCIMIGQASDTITTLNQNFHGWVGA